MKLLYNDLGKLFLPCCVIGSFGKTIRIFRVYYDANHINVCLRNQSNNNNNNNENIDHQLIKDHGFSMLCEIEPGHRSFKSSITWILDYILFWTRIIKVGPSLQQSHSGEIYFEASQSFYNLINKKKKNTNTGPAVASSRSVCDHYK